MLPSPCCCFGILEVFMFLIDSFKLKKSHVVEKYLVVCISDAKGVKFVNQCSTELIHVLRVHMINSFNAKG